MIGDEQKESFLGRDRVRLEPGVRRVRRSGALLLLAPGGNPVIVSPLVDEIWDLLVGGVTVDELAAALRGHRPHARDVSAKLDVFLGRLRRAGLLEGSGYRPSSARRGIELPIDPVASACATLLGRAPRPLLVTVIAGSAVASLDGFRRLLRRANHPRIRDLPEDLSVEGALIVVLVLAPLHELGHAVACRVAGVPAGPAGIRFSSVVVPRPYVRTSVAWGIEQKSRRWWIPAGGPLVDLLIGGCAAWALLLFDPPDAARSLARLVALYALIAINVGTSPIPVGDGSHLLEALLDDDFARNAALLRRPSRFVRPRSVRIYRLVCAAHIGCSAALMRALR